jgi:hypothetical protein
VKYQIYYRRIIMKKLIFVFIAAAAVAALAASCASKPAAAAASTPAEASGTYKIADEYKGDKNQGPLWYYLVRRDGGDWRELNYTREWGDNWQYSKNPARDGLYYSICTWEGIVTIESGAQKGGSVYEVALAFKAPFDGTITIPDFDVVSHADSENGGAEGDPPGPVAVTILKGAEQLASTTIDGYEGRVTGAAEITVSAGDMVYIYVDPLGVEVTNVIFDNLALVYTAK